MKNFLALAAMLALTSCAGVRVSDTQIATGAINPTAIYIQPFEVSENFSGYHYGPGETPIRQSLAPADFALALRTELEKIAPVKILEAGERAPGGWLVEGTLDTIDTGSPCKRLFLGHVGVGKSRVQIHVRIHDLGGRHLDADDKDTGTRRGRGNVVYEFDLDGGSRLTGGLGSLTAPGVGYAAPFDYKNAAQKIALALTTDPFRYGERTSTHQR